MYTTSTTNPRPKNAAEFKRRALAGFKRANPDARNIKITWEFARWVRFPTGLEGYSGVGQVTADGYRTKVLVATWTAHGLSVR